MPSHLARRTLLASTAAAAATPLLTSCGEIDGPPGPPSVQDRHDPDTVGGDVLIANALVFDGERFTGHDSVAVRGGLIAEVGRGLTAEDLPRFDAGGRVLLPGLIDAHAHRSGHNAHAGLRFGVTAMLDMYGAIDERGDRSDLGTRDRSDIWWAGWGLTVPGGHPTQWFPHAPTIQDAAEVRAFVADRAAEGSDYLKLLLQRAGPERTLALEEASAGVAAAHDHGMLAVAHVGDWEDALVAAKAGVDALVHLPWGETPNAEALELLAEGRTPVVATLTVTSAGRCDHSVDQFLDDPAVAERLDSGQRTEASYETRFCEDYDLDRWRDGTAASFDAIRQAELPLLVGTDNGNVPVVTGVSMYHEMAMFAEHGLSTEEILAGATSATADVFGLDERGRIAVDKRGDLLLLEATDAAQVIGSGAVAAVWKNGHAVELETRLGGGEVPQRRDVAVRAEARDHTFSVGRDVRVVPEGLALVHVRKVDLDERRGELGACVADRHGGVGPGGGVEHDRVPVVGGLVQPLEELALVVGLPEVDLQAQFLAGGDAQVGEVGERLGAVDRGLPLAEPVEVGAVQHQGLHPVSLS